MDEHRIGLKPITRGVWAPKGERPIALGHHRYEWLYIYGFVEPTTGRTVWNVANAVCKEMFEAVFADFAKSIGVGENKRAVLQLDNAGWHGPENLVAERLMTLGVDPERRNERRYCGSSRMFSAEEPGKRKTLARRRMGRINGGSAARSAARARPGHGVPAILSEQGP
jgi:hypothetical protein